MGRQEDQNRERDEFEPGAAQDLPMSDEEAEEVKGGGVIIGDGPHRPGSGIIGDGPRGK